MTEKIAFVTGADRGLGLALTARLLDKGWRVYAGQFLPKWPELSALGAQYGARLTAVPLDVADTESTRAAAELVAQYTPRVDLVINNAGVLSPHAGPIREPQDYDEMHRLYNVNALGPVRVVEALLPLTAQSALKRLCFISSEAGSISRCTRTSWYGYNMSKAALNMAVKLLFNRLRRDGYTFRVYHPGWMRTYMRGVKGTDATLEPEEAAVPALAYFLRDRAGDPHRADRYDEDRLVMRDDRAESGPGRLGRREMETRRLGQTELTVSALGFGCGAVGGLLVKGAYGDMLHTVARAIELGVTYFDTAAAYGNGQSEASLGRVLEELRADVVVGTKVQLRPDELDDIEQAVFRSVEASLRRLRMERVDLIQLHNRVVATHDRERAWVSADDVQAAARAFQKLHAQGRARCWGINGLGDTEVLHAVLESVGADSIQSCYNLLNPSAGQPVPEGFPFQDYGQLIDRAAEQQVGAIAIRVLAGGALSGSSARHANAAPSVAPIATSVTFDEDVARAQQFGFLVEEGYAESLVEAAIRFALAKPGVSTALVGLSNQEQLEQAVRAAERGPLPAPALERLGQVWANL